MTTQRTRTDAITDPHNSLSKAFKRSKNPALTKHGALVATTILNQWAKAQDRNGVWITKAEIGQPLNAGFTTADIMNALVDGKWGTRLGTNDKTTYCLVPTPKLIRFLKAKRDEQEREVELFVNEAGVLRLEHKGELAAVHKQHQDHVVFLKAEHADQVDAMNWQINHLNKLVVDQGARMTEVESKLDKMDSAHKTEMSAVWAAIAHIQATDAPVTAEKIERHLRVAQG